MSITYTHTWLWLKIDSLQTGHCRRCLYYCLYMTWSDITVMCLDHCICPKQRLPSKVTGASGWAKCCASGSIFSSPLGYARLDTRRSKKRKTRLDLNLTPHALRGEGNAERAHGGGRVWRPSPTCKLPMRAWLHQWPLPLPRAQTSPLLLSPYSLPRWPLPPPQDQSCPILHF